jgi:hypothetical protein
MPTPNPSTPQTCCPYVNWRMSCIHELHQHTLLLLGPYPFSFCCGINYKNTCHAQLNPTQPLMCPPLPYAATHGRCSTSHCHEACIKCEFPGQVKRSGWRLATTTARYRICQPIFHYTSVVLLGERWAHEGFRTTNGKHLPQCAMNQNVIHV